MLDVERIFQTAVDDVICSELERGRMPTSSDVTLIRLSVINGVQATLKAVKKEYFAHGTNE